MGEKAHLRTMAAVLANATATTLVYIPACRGQRGPAGRASPQAGAGLRPALQQQYIYVSPELYSLPVSQEFASLRPPLGGRTRLVWVNKFPRSGLCPGSLMTSHSLSQQTSRNFKGRSRRIGQLNKKIYCLTFQSHSELSKVTCNKT